MAKTKNVWDDYLTRPLDAEEKRELHEWSRDDLIEVNERLFGQSEVHDAGEPVDVKKALNEAGVEVPQPPPNPTYVGEMGAVQQGPLIVEGEDNAGRVPLPRDHALTGVVDEEPAFDEDAAKAEIWDLTVDELKENLKEFEQPVSGNQKELRERLLNAVREANTAQAD